MTNTSKKAYSLAMALAGVFILICTGFYAYELLTAYSPSNGQFVKDVFSDVFLPLLYMVALVTFAVFGFLFRSSLTGRTFKNVLAMLFASGFAALATLIWLITFFFDFVKTPHAGPGKLFGALLLLFGLVAVAYFALCAMPAPSHTISVLLGMGTALFVLFFAFYAYFDNSFALNSPIKLLDQVSSLALMLFFLLETRFRLGAVSEALLFPVGMSALLLSASNGIAALIYTAVEGRPLVIDMMHDFLFLGLSLYVMTRLLSFLLPPLFHEEPTEAPDDNMPPFEASGATAYIPADENAPKQETFDFDKAAEDEPIPLFTHETNAGEEEIGEASAEQPDINTPSEA